MDELSLTRFKRCSKCGCTKPAEKPYFNRSKRGRWGVQNFCRACSSAANRQWKKENPERAAAYQKCYQEENGEAERVRYREYYHKNKESLKQKRRERYLANRELYWERSKKWRRENPERYARYGLEYSRRWTAANREKARARVRRRTALLKGAGGTVDPEVAWEMYESQDGLCAYCETPLFGTYHLDHMTPLVRGGTHDWTNLAVACPKCNNRKYTKTTEEFMQTLREEVA